MSSAKPLKTVTFSFDDGVTQDRRMVALLDRYGLKGTFNINSGLLGLPGSLEVFGQRVSHDKIAPEEVAGLYRDHEVAVHTLTHPNLTGLEDAEALRQVNEDQANLERLSGQRVVGMAYPCGGVNHDARVAALIANGTALRYARTIISSYGFDYPEDLFRLSPTVHAIEFDRLDALAESFLKAEPDAPMLFYVWGHSYEFDAGDGWTRFERFCARIARQPGVAYLANREALL